MRLKGSTHPVAFVIDFAARVGGRTTNTAMRDDPDRRLLTSKEIATLLGVHPKQVYRLLKQGLPAHRVGGEWRFREHEVLAWSAERSAPALDSPAESERPAATAPRRAGHAALLAANGEATVRVLLSVLNSDGAEPLWGFVQSDRARSIAWLAAAKVDAAGSHGTTPPTHIGPSQTRVARVHLVEREVGLAARRAEKTALASLSKLRVASRPSTAGVVTHLEHALDRAHIDRERALRHATLYDSHQDVIEAILRDEAEVGLTTHAMAAQAGLAFHCIATESYGLLVRSDTMGSAAIVRLCEAAQSTAFKERLARLAGCDARGAGDIRYDEGRG